MIGWRGLLVVVGVMGVGLMAYPQHQDSLTAGAPSSQRHKRQQEPVNIDDTTLICLLSNDDASGNSCGPSPFDPPSPPPPHGPTPPPHGPTPPPHGPTPPPHGPPPPPSCSCVPYWQCKDKKSAPVVEGDSLTSIVLDLRSNLGCGAPEEVCCRQVDPHARPPTPPVDVTLSCGTRNLLGVGSTFYGFEDQETQFGEFPWTVAITSSQGYGPDSKPIFLAGGSLVHPQLVMSVAHKFTNVTAHTVLVRLGDWNLAKKTEAIPFQEIGVSEVLLHPGYSGTPYHYYDVVLLVLQRPAVLGPTVNTVCLPVHEDDFMSDKCVVSGWGKKDFNDVGRFQEVMKAVTMPLVNQEVCQTALQGTRLGRGFTLHDSFLCAGGQTEHQDSCTGDGGSPLVCPLRTDSSRYVQVGVVSWGIGCGRVGLPGVYADVLWVGQWIEMVLNDKFGASRDHGEGGSRPLIDVREHHS